MDEVTRLAAAARDGDRLAAAAFVRRSQAEVWRLCAHLAGREQADDLTQETYLRAFRALPGFRAESSARTWLLTIARRTVADWIRATRRRRRRDAALRPDPLVAGPDAAVADLVSRLDPERREAFVLTQVLGLAYAEAAEVCGCPVGTIRSRVARARAELVDAVRQASAS